MDEKYLLAAAIAVALIAAQRAPAQEASPETVAASPWMLNAYAAASWYRSTGYPGGTAPGGSGFDVHAFDLEHDPLQVDEFGSSLAYQPKQGFGALADVIAGQDASILRQAEGGDDSSFDVRQAYLQYATGGLTLMTGKFLTCAGAESIDPVQNFNYSRSLLFTLSEPLTLTGARAVYSVDDALTLDAGINNGWNVTSVGSGWHTGEAGVSWTESETLSLSLQSVFGALAPGGPQRTLLDLVVTDSVTSRLTLLLSADYDRQNGAAWYGAAATAAFAFDGRWRLALRGEYLDDADGFLTGIPQHLTEGTLTLGFKPVKQLELRAEWRSDFAQAPVFLRQPALDLYPYGPGTDRMSGQLGEIAVQAVYTFLGG